MALVLKTSGRKPSEVRTLYSPPWRRRLVADGRRLLTFVPKGHVGSNPTVSANCFFGEIEIVCFNAFS